MNPKVRDDVAFVELDSELVIYDRAEDGLHHLNPAAGIVFQLCDGSGTAEEMALDISAVGGMPFDEVLEQVTHMVKHFQDLGILEGSVRPSERDEVQDEAPDPHAGHDHSAHDHSAHDHAGEEQEEDPAKDPVALDEEDTQNH